MIRIEDRAAERKAEALLDAASRDPAEKWRFVDRCFGDDVPTPPTDCASALESLRRPRPDEADGGAAVRLRRALPAAAVDEVYYRDEVLAGLAHLVVDFEHLESTAKAAPCHLNEEVWRRIVRRLGVLNVKDPRALGGTYNLDLQQPDERRCAACSWRSSRIVRGAAARPEEKGEEEGACRRRAAEGPDAGDRLFEGPYLSATEKWDPEPGWVCPRSGARPRVRTLGSRRSGAWPAPTNRATGTSRTRKSRRTSWRSCDPGSSRLAAAACVVTTRQSPVRRKSDAPEHPAAPRPAPAAPRTPLASASRARHPAKPRGVHVDAACFACAPRDDEAISRGRRRLCDSPFSDRTNVQQQRVGRRSSASAKAPSVEKSTRINR